MLSSSVWPTYLTGSFDIVRASGAHLSDLSTSVPVANPLHGLGATILSDLSEVILIAPLSGGSGSESRLPVLPSHRTVLCLAAIQKAAMPAADPQTTVGDVADNFCVANRSENVSPLLIM